VEDETSTSEHEIRQVLGREQICHGYIDYDPDRDSAQQAYPETLSSRVKGEPLEQGRNRDERSSRHKTYYEV
jgi:hypothetical protein